ncbi:MAG: hypothetical protein AAF724_16240 [Pseudomonadota bacterium]
MKKRLTLDYALAEGSIAPHLDGLRAGRAVAAKCRKTGRVTMPPARSNALGDLFASDGSHDWIELSGEAAIIHRTDGPGGAFALVRFDGADNQAVGRIVNPEAVGRKARLRAAGENEPGLILEIVGDSRETA